MTDTEAHRIAARLAAEYAARGAHEIDHDLLCELGIGTVSIANEHLADWDLLEVIDHILEEMTPGSCVLHWRQFANDTVVYIGRDYIEIAKLLPEAPTVEIPAISNDDLAKTWLAEQLAEQNEQHNPMLLPAWAGGSGR